VILWGVVAADYFHQKSEGEIWVTTKASFGVLSTVIVIGFLKLFVELMIPKYRRQYFKKQKK